MSGQTEPTRVGWVLHNSVNAPMYAKSIPKLTTDELKHCLRLERRPTGLKRLQAEARRRGLRFAPKPAGEAGDSFAVCP